MVNHQIYLKFNKFLGNIDIDKSWACYFQFFDGIMRGNLFNDLFGYILRRGFYSFGLHKFKLFIVIKSYDERIFFKFLSTFSKPEMIMAPLNW